jgi:hypothetical protein
LLTTFWLANHMDKDHWGYKDSDGGIIFKCRIGKKIVGI